MRYSREIYRRRLHRAVERGALWRGSGNVSENKGRLLIVDDELSVRDSLNKWFREEGYEVGTAENASEALLRLAEHPWDIALLDIKMRGTDGIELQRRIHELDPKLIVIMMTGYASVETAVAALKNGAYDYVTKPLDPDEIAHLMHNALSHRAAREENVRLRRELRESAPKVGNYDDRVDELLVKLFDMFADACDAAGENGRGGRFHLAAGGSSEAVSALRAGSRLRRPAILKTP